MSKKKKLEIRLTEQEHELIMKVLKPKYENVSLLIREFLKSKIKEEIQNNKDLEDKLKEEMYSEFFNSK